MKKQLGQRQRLLLMQLARGCDVHFILFRQVRGLIRFRFRPATISISGSGPGSQTNLPRAASLASPQTEDAPPLIATVILLLHLPLTLVSLVLFLLFRGHGNPCAIKTTHTPLLSLSGPNTPSGNFDAPSTSTPSGSSTRHTPNTHMSIASTTTQLVSSASSRLLFNLPCPLPPICITANPKVIRCFADSIQKHSQHILPITT